MTSRPAPNRPDVSILVVLDWVFKPAGAREPDTVPDGFNPCCIGLGIQTELQEIYLERGEMFQSLLYWIGYSNILMQNTKHLP